MQPDEVEIRRRVKRRWNARLRFMVHVFLTLPMIVIFGMIGMNGARGPDRGDMYAAAGLFMLWITSVMIHFVWLIFSELSERAIQKEIDRQWQLAILAEQSQEKPKRGVARLNAVGDDGELADLFEEDSQDIAVSKRV